LKEWSFVVLWLLAKYDQAIFRFNTDRILN
jgi:hypothetical protein